MNPETQNAQILAHLLSGKSITPMDALQMFGSFRLGARIYDLKAKGYAIQRQLVTENGKRFAEYWMDAEERERHG